MRKPGRSGILAQQVAIFIAVELFSSTEIIEFQFPVLECIGPNVSQDVLDRVLPAVRRENNQTLELFSFRLKFTNLVQLDLTPFEGGKFQHILFENNSLLSRVVGPDLNSTAWNPITTLTLDWTSNNFQDEGLQIMLRYFNKAEIFNLFLSGNKLTGSLGQEFLPGFSNLSSVISLSLDNNNIRGLGGGQFRGMSKLELLIMENNGLTEIGEDAFAMDGPVPSPFFTLQIYLNDNNLTDESFHPSSGISNTNRKVKIILDNNQFTKLRENKFKSFLETFSWNNLTFDGNPIWCDPEMKWFKDRREEFEPRVTGLNCVNDPGKTVFTSSLVDG